ncbi:MAG: PAS domain S-box protein, partial [Deltaproteobacteria bacterium]|nr:PAS domain S-box protein [Deltaproteobacteria bacterium]
MERRTMGTKKSAQKAEQEETGLYSPEVLHCLQQMGRSLSMGMFILVGGTIVYVSNGTAKLFKSTPREMQDAFFLDWLHPEDREKVKSWFLAGQHGEEVPDRYEFRGLTKEGEAVWLEVRAVPVTYRGRPAIMGFAADITARKKEREVLEQQAIESAREMQNLRDVLTTSIERCPLPVLVLTLDDGILRDVNDAFFQATGYSRSEAVGKTTVELGLWEDPAHQDRIHATLKSKGSIRNEEIVIRNRWGNRRIFLYTAEVVYYQDCMHVLGISQDVTDLKDALARKAESEARYRDLVRGAPVGMGEVDIATGRLVFANERLAEFSGYSVKELLGMPMEELFDLESRQEVRRKAAALEKGELPGPFQAKFRGRDGTEKWGLLALNLAGQGKGAPRLRAIVTDVTDQ